MNKLMVSMIALLAVLIVSSQIVVAQDDIPVPTLYEDNANNDSDDEEAAVTPEVEEEIKTIDSELNEDVSSWGINKEKMKNWFTFNQEKKAEREFKIARMLLVKAKIEAKNNDSEAMEQALEAHNEILERIQLRVKERKTDDNSSVEADKLVGLDRAIQVHEITIARWSSLLENENLTDDQRTRMESRIAKAENVTAKLQEVQDDRIDKLRVRLMAVANLSEDQANAIIDELERSHNLKEIREAVKEVRKNNEYKLEEKIRLREGSVRTEIQRRIEMKDGRLREEIRQKIRDGSDDDSEDEVEDESDDDSNSGVDDEDDSEDDSDDDDSDDDSSDSSNSGSGKSN